MGTSNHDALRITLMNKSMAEKPNKNAEKQKRFRERQKNKGQKEVRGYLTPEALECYKRLSEQTGWTDSVLLSNTVRLAYASYKKGQIQLLNQWLKQNNL